MFTGLTAKKSATIPVCLAEIDRSRAQSPHDWEFATDRVTQLVNAGATGQRPRIWKIPCIKGLLL
jgi:hypothetical protein